MNSPPIQANVSLFFDALRGGSAIVVLCSHVYKTFLLPYSGYGVLWDLVSIAAVYAVMVFFVLSGFMITTSIMTNVARYGRFSAPAFLRARLLRLYPPLICSLLLVLMVFGLIQGLQLHGADSYRLLGDTVLFQERASLDGWVLLGNLFFLQNMLPAVEPPVLNDPLWSLSFEFWYYMGAMCFAMVWVNRQWVVGLLPFVLLLAYALFSPWSHPRFAIWSFVWISGCVLAVLYHKGLILHRRFNLYGFLMALFLASAVIAIASANPYNYLFTTKYEGSIVVQALLSLLFATCTGLYLRRQLLGGKPWRLVRLSHTAHYSYTLYIIHVPLLAMAFSLLHPLLHSLHWGFSLLVCLPIAWLIIVIAKPVAAIVEDRRRMSNLIAQASKG